MEKKALTAILPDGNGNYADSQATKGAPLKGQTPRFFIIVKFSALPQHSISTQFSRKAFTAEIEPISIPSDRSVPAFYSSSFLKSRAECRMGSGLEKQLFPSSASGVTSGVRS
jgi:hypothetical protein